jgi:hypothetical protein
VPQLDEAAAVGLVGPDVTTLKEASAVEAVSAEQVAQAEKAADLAERRAAESEQAALEAKIAPTQAAADREAARFARLRAHVTARRAERHAQAERIRGLHDVGQAALGHAAALKDLRDQTLADLATIQDLQDAIRSRVREWNQRLIEIASQGAALAPHPLRPGGTAHPASAGVHAAVINPDPDGKETATVVAGGTTVTGIWAQHPDGVIAGVDAAVRQVTPHDPGTRLYRGPNGLTAPVPTGGAGEHVLRRIAAGELHELTVDEKRAYYAGETS